MITTPGHINVAQRWAPDPVVGSPMFYIGIGTGTPSGIALGNELSRKVFSQSITGNVITDSVMWTQDDYVEGNITEAGIFTLNGNIMIASGTFTAIPKTIYDNLTITWNLTT